MGHWVAILLIGSMSKMLDSDIFWQGCHKSNPRYKKEALCHVALYIIMYWGGIHTPPLSQKKGKTPRTFWGKSMIVPALRLTT